LHNDILSQRVIALNLSKATIIEDSHCATFLQKLGELTPEQRMNLNLEFSESIVINHFDQVMVFMRALQQLGIKTGIDQVGIHFSPLHYLNQLPLSYLKLHGSLIQDIDENQNKQFFIHYFCEMATILDFQVIATQIETANQWEALKSLRMRWGQGHFWGNPVYLLTENKNRN